MGLGDQHRIRIHNGLQHDAQPYMEQARAIMHQTREQILLSPVGLTTYQIHRELDDGTVINCLKVGDQEVTDVYLVTKIEKEEKKKEEPQFCPLAILVYKELDNSGDHGYLFLDWDLVPTYYMESAEVRENYFATTPLYLYEEETITGPVTTGTTDQLPIDTMPSQYFYGQATTSDYFYWFNATSTTNTVGTPTWYYVSDNSTYGTEAGTPTRTLYQHNTYIYGQRKFSGMDYLHNSYTLTEGGGYGAELFGNRYVKWYWKENYDSNKVSIYEQFRYYHWEGVSHSALDGAVIINGASHHMYTQIYDATIPENPSLSPIWNTVGTGENVKDYRGTAYEYPEKTKYDVANYGATLNIDYKVYSEQMDYYIPQDDAVNMERKELCLVGSALFVDNADGNTATSQLLYYHLVQDNKYTSRRFPANGIIKFGSKQYYGVKYRFDTYENHALILFMMRKKV